MASSTSGSPTVDTRDFYGEYHGHRVNHLQSLLPLLRSSSDGLIWTAGDSSLDNKYWFADQRPAVGAYAQILDPPVSVCDVTYWLNYLSSSSEAHGSTDNWKWAAINCAVEATTLNQRCHSLLPQDEFIRDNIGSDDVLIVSIGGNDIALRPAPCTIMSIAGLLCLPSRILDAGFSYCSIPVDDCFCGCGPSLASCLGACPPCLGYFRHMFGTRIEKYIKKLTAKKKPKQILVCMIYYLDENLAPSWAGPALSALGYNSNPGKLQLLIKKIFTEAISRIQILGCEVIPVPLFHVLDGKNSRDYVARVEPSARGGKKMAEFFLDTILRGTQYVHNSIAAAPVTSLISERT
mmetsp:Transcript_35688/g.52341  ORF Transcript_35688/g.52341 Transcript_35688/m.52341 type:complete len:349 (-) Transcript_35688:144-1190(-)|eukprot:CAMPEP_0195522450 /NCGR_PEP_ID=MMETSP0794_2-20130614/20641_1 /TAXON_ID=515487 /ORGANISM="Stephanopyxis turris, Strain CCMP 815" /LENGTH=348 /DNA_ID=CAMNT_0040652213 /DNA_START=141 /DNA_END=1187 /DNA_ORIENTATION=+